MKLTAHRLNQIANRGVSYVAATTHWLIVLFCIASCASVCHRDRVLYRTLLAQVHLIEKLSAERNTKSVKNGVRKNAQLSVAEEHLNASLNALLDSVKTVRANYFQKQEGVANERSE